jgi:hypothetical protein
LWQAWKEMYIIGNHSQLPILFGDAEDTASQKNVGVYVKLWEVYPTLSVLKVCSKWKCVMAPRRTVVHCRLETIV